MYIYCIAPYGKLESNFIKIGFCTKIETLKKRYTTYYGSSHRSYYIKVKHSTYEDIIHKRLKALGLHIENELFVYNKVNDFYFYVQQLNELNSIESKIIKNDKVNNSKNIVKKLNNIDVMFKKININPVNIKYKLLIDEYKPMNYKDICGNKKNIDNIINWFSNWDNHKNKCMLLSGPIGIGKTLSIELICKNLKYDIIYYNNENLDFLIKKTDNKSIYNKRKVLIIDGCEFLDKYEINIILNSIINNIIKSPIVLICNEKSEYMKNIVDLCYETRFTKLDINDIKPHIKKICLKEKIIKSDYEINKTILLKMFDIRAIINDINFYNNIESNVIKDLFLNVDETYNQIINNKKYDLNIKINHYFDNYEQLDKYIYENEYINNDNIEDVYKHLDILSFSDTLCFREDELHTKIYKSLFNIVSINCLFKK